MMSRAIVIFFALLFCHGCFSQTTYITKKNAKGKLRTTYERAVRMAGLGELEQAITDLEKAIKSEPNFIDAHIEWANVKNRQGKFAEAESGYERAIEIDSNYLSGLLYSLAIVEFDQKKYDEASVHFTAFLQKDRISEKRRANAENYLRNAKFAAEALANPVPFEPQNLGPNINTAEDEYLPTLTADGEKLIYTAMRHNQEDFFLSKKMNGEWQPGKAISSVNTPDYNEGAQSISVDGKLLVFTICNRPGGLGRCDLYGTEMRDNAWTKVVNMGEPINTPAYESLPSLSADGQMLFFTSDRKGGQGKTDIWMSRRGANGKWERPQNLGSEINTPKQEKSPFLHPDGQTLYFASQGHTGMGGFDLFMSRLQEDGTWGAPKNLGHPINTEGDEGAFYLSLDGRTAYISSDMEGGFGRNDIYTFELYGDARPKAVTYVKAIVRDAKSRRPISANVSFVDLGNGKTHTSATTGEDGEFLVTLPVGKDYALNVSKEKYLFHSENFALADGTSTDEPYVMEILLSPIPEEFAEGSGTEPIILKNVFFGSGSAELKPESRTELELLIKLLDENVQLKIQINGHTDDVGGEADNLKLSEARAKAVHDFLLENGIPAARLRYRGFGETMPIVPNDSEDGRRQNRRTEFELIE